MFEAFYHLREQPFSTNPDPRFLYLSGTHREAFSSLLYRIQTDAGFLAMVAQPGMGKTTLLFHLLHRLQSTAKTAFIFQTQCTSHEFLRHLLSEFECDTSVTDPVRMSQELKALLLAEANAGRRCILLIDEAQNLVPEVLETIRLLSNFETPRRKLLQIILSGQSELGDMLARTELRQLRQRLSCIVRIQRFSPEETTRYIAHRLAVAGYTGKVSELFSLQALSRVAKLSEGIPRVINNICFNALSLGFALEYEQIDREVVDEVANDLGLLCALPGNSMEPSETVSADLVRAADWEEGGDAFKSIAAACIEQEHVEPKTAAAFTIETADADLLNESVQRAGGGEGPKTEEIGGGPHESVSDSLFSPAVRVGTHALPEVAKHPTPVAATAWTRVQDALKKATDKYLALGCVCALGLTIIPAIYAPAHRHVSAAQKAVDLSVASPALAAAINSTQAPKLTLTAADQEQLPNEEVNFPGAFHHPLSTSSALSTQGNDFQIEKRRKLIQNPGVAAHLALTSVDSKTLLRPSPLEATPATSHSNGAAAPGLKLSRALTPAAPSLSTSEILLPAPCSQQPYGSLTELIRIWNDAQTQQTIPCSFLPLKAKESSTK